MRYLTACALVLGAFAFSACGGGSDGAEEFSGDEVRSAFEEAAGGFPFEQVTTLVEGDAVAYGPQSDADPAEVVELDEELGEGSVLWQVVVFEGSEPPTGKEAAKEVAFASERFEEVEENVFIGDSDIAYIVNGNAVANGPALEGDPKDETVQGWKSAVESLGG